MTAHAITTGENIPAIVSRSEAVGWPHRMTSREGERLAVYLAADEHRRTGVNVYDAHCWAPWHGLMGATVTSRYRSHRARTIRPNIRCTITVARRDVRLSYAVVTWEDGSYAYLRTRKLVVPAGVLR